MTSLDFRCRETCAVCACRIRGVLVGSFRINKNSLRSVSTTLTFVEPRCPECSHPTPWSAGRWALSAESAEKVRAYRARKGWA